MRFLSFCIFILLFTSSIFAQNDDYKLLFSYCENGDFDGIKNILPKIKNINQLDDHGGSALNIACSNKHYEIAIFLINNGANVNINGMYYGAPIISAVFSNDIDFLKIIIKHGADINLKDPALGLTAIDLAISRDKDEIAQYLFKIGAKMYEYKTLYDQKLLNEASKKNFDGIEKYLKLGADINAKNYLGGTSLIYCIDDYKIVEYLITNGANVNAQEAADSVLNIAIEKSTNDVIKLLIKKGANINFKNIDGITPLKIAIKKNNIEIINLLKEMKAKE